MSQRDVVARMAKLEMSPLDKIANRVQAWAEQASDEDKVAWLEMEEAFVAFLGITWEEIKNPVSPEDNLRMEAAVLLDWLLVRLYQLRDGGHLTGDFADFQRAITSLRPEGQK